MSFPNLLEFLWASLSDVYSQYILNDLTIDKKIHTKHSKNVSNFSGFKLAATMRVCALNTWLKECRSKSIGNFFLQVIDLPKNNAWHKKDVKVNAAPIVKPVKMLTIQELGTRRLLHQIESYSVLEIHVWYWNQIKTYAYGTCRPDFCFPIQSQPYKDLSMRSFSRPEVYTRWLFAST